MHLFVTLASLSLLLSAATCNTTEQPALVPNAQTQRLGQRLRTELVTRYLPADQVTNTVAIGRVLYTDFVYFFQAAGLILLVAMIGAIVLTLRERVGVKRQVISEQVDRTRETAVEVRQVPSRQGV